MEIIVKKIDSSGGILTAEIAESGFGYKLNQTLNIVGGNNDSQLKITSLQKNSSISIGKDAINLPVTKAGKGYCLPNIENNYNCNPATSLDILVSKGNGQYEWGCQCLYPNYFTHIKSDGLSSCDRISREICGGDENNDGSKLFYIPETDSSGNIIKCSEKCTNSKSTCVSKIDVSYCYIPWEISKMDIDPKYGICMCPSGSAFADDSKDGNISKNCVTNPCYPGKMKGTTSNYTCDCDKTVNSGNYISCLALQENPINLKLKEKCQVFGDQCVPDECGLGKWNPETKACTCSPGPSIGAVNEDNLIGETCKDVCLGRNDICPSESTSCIYTNQTSGDLIYRGILCSPCPTGRCNYDGTNCDIDFTTTRNCQGYLRK